MKSSDKSLPRPPNPSRASAKVWFFRLFTAVVIPAVLLLLLEGGLRVAGFGRPTGFFIPDEKPGYVRTNPDYVSLFMPGSFDLRQLNYRIAEKKPAGTVRIFVLGESAVQGIPAPAFAFVPQLRAQFRQGDRPIEVINTGVVAINSHVVYQIAREAARYEPDVFVVYMGNNEVVGPYGPGCAYLSQMWPPWLIRLNVAIRSTRTGQLLGAVANRFAGLKPPPPEWGGMAMFMDHAVRGDDPRLAAVERNFATNLRDIVRVAAGAGAKTILCTPVANLKDCPPFLSLHRPNLAGAELAAWQAAFAAGKLAWKLDEFDQARRHLEEAWRLDPQYADTAFMLGSLAHRAGNLDEARRHFIAAQHWDALRFRPSPALNDIVRQVAREHRGVILKDTARALGSADRTVGECTGRELMLEHVHPDWEGNRRIARLMAGAVGTAISGRPETGSLASDSSYNANAVGYTPVERFGVLQRAALITRHAPFPNQLTYAEDQARTAREIAAAEAVRRDPAALQQAYATVQRAIANDPDNADLAKIAVELADDLGDLPAALAEVRRAQTLQPANFALATDEAIKLGRLGRFQEAEKLLLATAATCVPRDLDKMTPALADFYTRTKRYVDGRRWFEEALLRRPGSQHLLFYRGRLAQAAGDLTAAEVDYRAVLGATPANETALESLVALLHRQGKTNEAEELCVLHVRWQPDNQANHLRAAQIHEARGQTGEAAQALLAAVRSGPAPLPVRLRLANLLYSLKQPREALDQLATAWRLARAEGDPEVTVSIRELINRIRAEAERR